MLERNHYLNRIAGLEQALRLADPTNPMLTDPASTPSPTPNADRGDVTLAFCTGLG